MASWPSPALDRAVLMGLVDRRPIKGRWMVPVADAALLVLARRTADIFGAQPSSRVVSLWRSAVVQASDGAPIVVIRPGHRVSTTPGPIDLMLATGEPVLAVSVPTLVAEICAIASRT